MGHSHLVLLQCILMEAHSSLSKCNNHCLVEVSFDELSQQPIETIHHIYESFKSPKAVNRVMRHVRNSYSIYFSNIAMAAILWICLVY